MRSASTKDLFCPLNWGLGHATRTIPLIKEALAKGHEVHIASDGLAGKLLQAEFPQCKYFEIPGYGVSYPFKSMRWNIIFQWPGILWAIWRERQWIKKKMEDEGYDRIISDNRYGCWHSEAENIIITHQINPPTNAWLTDKVATLISRWFLRPYQEVWIPDDDKLRITGKMTANAPKHARFIGFLSRMKKVDMKKKDGVLMVLSGPEPQRTYFEKQLISQIEPLAIPFKLVRGVTDGTMGWRSLGKHGQVTDFLTHQELEKELAQAEVVIGRSGYTSIMDYIETGVKAIMVPTPGQYEQEYLAETIKMPQFIFRKEEGLDLGRELRVKSL
jgi:hypothetical protein